MTDLATRPSIDPRIADRRDEVERGRRRRRLRWLVLVAVLLALVGVALGVTRSALLDVDRVRVEGATRTGADAVRAAVPVEIGEPMLDVDLEATRDAVGALPWVASVSVERRWPATLHVEVTERRPVAVVGGDDTGWWVVDAEGRVLAAVDGPPDDLVQLRDVPPAAVGEQLDGPADLADRLAVAAAVPPELRAEIDAVATGPEGDLVLAIIPAGRVRLGDVARLDEKVAAALLLFQQVDDRCIAVMDVRVPSVPTIERDPACAGPPTTEPVDGTAVDGTAVDATAVDATAGDGTAVDGTAPLDATGAPSGTTG